MGSEVTILEALPRILAPTDVDAGNVVARSFKKRGINVHTSARVTGIEGATELTVTWETDAGEKSVVVDKVIVSVGRAPPQRRLRARGAPASRSTSAASSWSTARCAPSVDGVYAVGDVVDTPRSRTSASRRRSSSSRRSSASRRAGRLRQGAVGHLLPPRGRVLRPHRGAGARAGYDVVVSSHRFAGDGRALILGETDGLVKIVADADGPMLGVHIVGPWATELLAEGYLCVNWEANAADIASLIHPHPTLSELFGESALALTGRSLH